jgi:glycosyltransferase involved in cell wall biosynthesis
MNWHLVTYADETFGEESVTKQRILHRVHGGLIAHPYNRTWLKSHKLYKKHRDVFDHKKTGGMWAWKPLAILEAMKECEEGDLILYIDRKDMFSPGIMSFVNANMDEDDPCLLLLGNNRNADYTKPETFVLMDCDEEDYRDSQQLEAGLQVWKVCKRAKILLEEYLMWCLEYSVNSDESANGEFDNHRWDQSILTNLAIREGLSVSHHEFREYIECDYDYWYERLDEGKINPYREIDRFLVASRNTIKNLNHKATYSLILTVHNQEQLIPHVLKGIEENTTGDYELIVVLDGCTDNSKGVVLNYVKQSEAFRGRVTITRTPDVFETKANNTGLKLASGDYVIIIQDDMVIREMGWNDRMSRPFVAFDDVFAVTARTSHNYEFNPNSKHLGMKQDLDNCWCDIVEPCDMADRNNISRNVFAVRGTVNRGPLMINHADLKKLNYFDEAFSPQDMDDHDLMFRMRKKLKKVCGCYWIDFVSDPNWGGTRKETGEPAPWLYKTQHKNSKIFYKRNKNYLEKYRIIENRELPDES